MRRPSAILNVEAGSSSEDYVLRYARGNDPLRYTRNTVGALTLSLSPLLEPTFSRESLLGFRVGQLFAAGNNFIPATNNRHKFQAECRLTKEGCHFTGSRGGFRTSTRFIFAFKKYPSTALYRNLNRVLISRNLSPKRVCGAPGNTKCFRSKTNFRALTGRKKLKHALPCKH